MRDALLPALYQPPSPWFPGGEYVRDDFLPSIPDNADRGPDTGGYFPGREVPLGDAKMKDALLPSMTDRNEGLMPGSYVKKSIYRFWDAPNWLDPRLKGTPAYYPHALISYFHWGQLRFKKFPEDGHILGDSGGFSIMTLGAVIDPRDVIRWQMRECTAGIILDVPPIDQRADRIYKDALAGTLRNVKTALPQYEKHRREGGKFGWWGAVHGWTNEELEYWWKEVRKVYAFTEPEDGWAFKPRPGINALTTARVMRFIGQQPTIKKAHFLMTTGADAVATILALGDEVGIEFATYDSTTFALRAINRSIHNPTADGLRWDAMMERGDERTVRDYMLNTCTCPACDLLRAEVAQYDDLLEKNKKWSGYWVFKCGFHNLLCALKIFENLRNAVRSHNGNAAAALTAVLGKQQASRVLRVFSGREVSADASGTSGGLLGYL